MLARNRITVTATIRVRIHLPLFFGDGTDAEFSYAAGERGSIPFARGRFARLIRITVLRHHGGEARQVVEFVLRRSAWQRILALAIDPRVVDAEGVRGDDVVKVALGRVQP